MTTAADVLAVARRYLGTAESPPGSNNVVFNTRYYGHPVSGSQWPWCAAFVSEVAIEAGAGRIIPKHAYTPTGAAWFQARGQWSRTPRVGDVVYYQWPGMNRISHTGYVEAVNSDGSWVAIEGNTDGGGSRTGGRVMRQRRSSLGALGGFGHPAYDAAPATVKPSAPAPAAPAAAPAASGPTATAGPAFPGVLRKGSKGDAVLTLQRRLKEHADGAGYAFDYSSGLGIFGDCTDAAVRWYQTCRHGAPYNLDVDGVVGPATWGSLWH